MIGIIYGVLSAALTLQFYGNSFDWGQTQSFEPHIIHVYVPVGFDDNDLSQVIVEVEFKDTCEEIGRAVVIPHEDNSKVLQLYVEAHRRSGFCLQVVNRKIKVVDIGVLPEGHYEIRDYKNLSKKYSELHVRKAKTATIDDSTYAPIDSLIMQKDNEGVRRILTLAGTFSNTCLAFDKIIVAKTHLHLIEVLPIVKMEDREDCLNKDVPFMIHKALPEFKGKQKITSGRYLFHVRTMGGGSFNKIDYVRMLPDDPMIPN